MEAYRLVYRLIYMLGQPRPLFIGVCVIIGLAVFGGGSFSDAIPYAVLWGMACFASRFLIVALPRPSSSGTKLPSEKALPKPAMAVSITPSCPPEACPGREAMTARLPEDIRALIR
jgi:hypothetical protein